MRSPIPALIAIGIIAVSCGAPSGRRPGFDPGDVLFWRISSADTTRDRCGDAPQLDSVLVTPSVMPGTHLVVEVSDDAATAQWLRCATREVATCERDPADPVFAVASDTITFQRTTKIPVENGEGCVLQVVEDWRLVDRGLSLDGSIVRTHSLVDSEVGCSVVNLDFMASSTNGYGLDGCALTTAVQADLD